MTEHFKCECHKYNYCPKGTKHEFFFDKLTEEDLKADPESVHAIGCKNCDFRLVTTAKELSKKEKEWAFQVIQKSQERPSEDEPK